MIEITVVAMPEGAPRWNLVNEFLRLRKSVFVDRMCWSLHYSDEREFEQYDTIVSVYVIAHHGDKVVGGARLLRTDRTIGVGKVVYSYMIRDAWRDLLDGMPPEICYQEPPTDAGVWELTRLASIDDSSISKAILRAANAFLKRQDARQCLFLGPPAFMRMAKSMGFSPTPIGPVTGNQDGRFLAFSCAVI